MKIIIDAREIKQNSAGKGRYEKELVCALSIVDKINNYILLTKDKPELKVGDNFTWKIVNGSFFLKLPLILAKEKPDVFISPTSYLAAYLSRRKTIVVVHDLAVFVEKKAKPTLKTKLMEKIFLPLIAQRKNIHFVCVSKSTKIDLARLFKIEPNKIAVVYPAPFLVSKDLPANQIVQKKYQLAKRFILFVGTIEPRKNIENLIKAYNLLPPAEKKVVPLIIVGKVGWDAGSVDRLIGQLKLEKNIRKIGFLDDKILPVVYRLATIFVYPSWYEGFGLPVLEAMAQKTPVITSNVSSLPEIVGDAALTVSPSDYQSLAQQIHQLLSDGKVHDHYSRLAYLQSQKFNWQLTATQILGIINKI